MKTKKIYFILFCLLTCLAIMQDVNAQDFNINMEGVVNPPIQSVGTFFINDASFTYTIGVVNQTGNVQYVIDSPLDPNSGLTVTTPAGFVDPNNPAGHVSISPSGSAITGSYTFVMQVTDQDSPANEVFQEFSITVQRRPVSVVFVLDRSGSMGWALGSNISVASPDRRWDDIVTGGGLFGAQFAAPGIGLDGDQLGVVYFESVPNTGVATGADFTNGFYTQPFNTINGELSGQTPGGWTAMGEGLLEARFMLESADVPADNRKVILLFTDGEQNRGREVQPDGRTITGGGNPNPENINPTGEIEIYPVAIFGPGGYLSILQNIALQNNDDGIALFTSGTPPPDGGGLTYEDINVFFLNSLNTILQGSSPQLIELRSGNLDSQGFAEETFAVNDNIEHLYFYTLSKERVNFELGIEKDGISISPGYQSSGSGYNFYGIDFQEEYPVVTSGGEWRVQLYGRGNGSYKIGAVVNDHHLKLSYDLESSYKVGDAITTTVSINFEGTPITDAETVLWTVIKPGGDLQDKLSVTGSDTDFSDAQDAGSVGLQKYFDLLENDPDFVKELLASEQFVPLTNNGDGTYSGVFNNTDVTGIYQFIYFIKGDHPNIGTYVRTKFRSAAIGFDTIDNDISEMTSQIIDGGISLTYGPAYNVGNEVRFVGPAYGNYIHVNGEGISVQKITDNGDGSYTIELAGNPDADITISVMGEDVYVGKASDFGESGSIIDKFKDWLKKTFGITLWLFILILLVILVIIWVIIKK